MAMPTPIPAQDFFPCPVCEKPFGSPQGQTAHTRIVHPAHFDRHGVNKAPKKDPAAKTKTVIRRGKDQAAPPLIEEEELDLSSYTSPNATIPVPPMDIREVLLTALTAYDHINASIELVEAELKTVREELARQTGLKDREGVLAAQHAKLIEIRAQFSNPVPMTAGAGGGS